jgi:hypothetical protein
MENQIQPQTDKDIRQANPAPKKFDTLEPDEIIDPSEPQAPEEIEEPEEEPTTTANDLKPGV